MKTFEWVVDDKAGSFGDKYWNAPEQQVNGLLRRVNIILVAVNFSAATPFQGVDVKSKYGDFLLKVQRL
jgi:hypothetical protein